MHTPRVLSFSSSLFRPAAASAGKLASLALLAGGLIGLAVPAHADDLQTFLGAGVGAVAGAAIGQSVGGRNGAIVGAGAGGLVGASIASQGHAQQRPVQQTYAPNPYVNSYYPVTYYRQPVVTWQAPPPQYYGWREERHHDHGHHYGHQDRYESQDRGYDEDRRGRRD